MGVAELTSAGGERGVADPGQRDAAPNCPCHGEPAYRRVSGRGRVDWQCAVAKREQLRRRYDADPAYRIGKNLHDQARRRRETIERQRQAMTPTEGG